MIFRLALGYLIFVIGLGWGMAIGRYHVFPYSIIKPYHDELKAFLIDDPDVTQPQSITEKIRYHRQERKTDSKFGGFLIRDEQFADDGYLLISRYSLDHNQVIVELVQVLEFEIVHQWIPPIDEILQRSRTDNEWNSKEGYSAQHPLLLPNGSIVFHSGEGPLVRLDTCSNIEWILDKHFHHTIELSHDQYLVVPIKNVPPLLQFPKNLRDDGFAFVSLDGKIKKVFSVGKILMQNGYRGLFLGVGWFDSDKIHLNDAQPIHDNIGSARIGDIALSIRHLSTVMLYRPEKNKIIWSKTGPWLFQHDVNLLENGSFSVFGNDVILGKPLQYPSPISQVYVYNPENGSIQTPYLEALEKLKMRSHSSGRARILRNGDVYIEQWEGARLLRTTHNAPRWEYVNKISANTTGALHWSRYLYKEEVPTFKWQTICT